MHLTIHQASWIKIARSKAGNFEFTRATVGDGIFNHFIDRFFVCCLTNLLLEGQFSLFDHYTYAGHDELMRETILQFVNWVLVEQREQNRDSSLRTAGRAQPGKEDQPLDDEHKSDNQLEAFAKYVKKYASQHTAKQINEAFHRYEERREARSQELKEAAKVKGDPGITDTCTGCGSEASPGMDACMDASIHTYSHACLHAYSHTYTHACGHAWVQRTCYTAAMALTTMAPTARWPTAWSAQAGPLPSWRASTSARITRRSAESDGLVDKKNATITRRN